MVENGIGAQEKVADFTEDIVVIHPKLERTEVLDHPKMAYLAGFDLGKIHAVGGANDVIQLFMDGLAKVLHRHFGDGLADLPQENEVGVRHIRRKPVLAIVVIELRVTAVALIGVG
jgi:hypothetical protein